MIQTIKSTFQHFIQSNTFQKGASLAYHSVFSILPIIIVITSMLGLLFGKQAVAGEINEQLQSTLGSNTALAIENLIKNHHTKHNSVFTSIIGFLTLALSASGLFNQIHNAFNSIWNIKSKPKNNFLNYVTKHFSSLLLLTVLFVVMFISTSLNSFLVHQSNITELPTNWFIVEHFISFVVMSLIFTIMFKHLGDAIVQWKVAFYGGLITAILFLFGKVIISQHIGHSNLTTTYGSASMLVVLMMWTYYTSQILFLGASFVKIIGDKLNTPVLPNSDAIEIQ